VVCSKEKKWRFPAVVMMFITSWQINLLVPLAFSSGARIAYAYFVHQTEMTVSVGAGVKMHAERDRR